MVKEILRKSNPCQWHYVNTKENPADLLSRGTSLKKLKESSIWFHGPEWLKQEDEWPILNQNKAENARTKSDLSVSLPILGTKQADDDFSSPHF